MKKLLTLLFSLPILFSGMSSFAASPDDVIPVTSGSVTCWGTQATRHRIGNYNADLNLLINRIVISDGYGNIQYDSDTDPEGFYPWSDQNPVVLQPRQGRGFYADGFLIEVAGLDPLVVQELQTPLLTSISFSIADSYGEATAGLAPAFVSSQYTGSGIFGVECRYTELNAEKIKGPKK